MKPTYILLHTSLNAFTSYTMIWAHRIVIFCEQMTGTEKQTFTFLSTSHGNIQQVNANLFYYHLNIRPLIIGNQSTPLTIR
jgi:hypothetical protein